MKMINMKTIKFRNATVPIGNAVIGMVVTERDDDIFSTGKSPDVGHIVGFSRNSYDEVLVVVRWSRKRPERLGGHHEVEIHPSNVNLEVGN